MKNFVEIHPVINKIEPLNANEFTFFETLNFLFIPLSFQYNVVIQADEIHKTVQMKSSIIGLVDLTIDFQISPSVEGCNIEERINFKSKIPVGFIMKGIFKKQHKQLFQNIEHKIFN